MKLNLTALTNRRSTGEDVAGFYSDFCPLIFAERDIKVVRPLYSVEVTETETAKFETEISEEDVHGNWKLKGEALHQSAVSLQ